MSSIIHSQASDIPANMTTTAFDVPGFRTVDNLGVVRGVVVRSRSVFGTAGAALQTMFGGNISLFTELAERTRKQAFETMLVQAQEGVQGLELREVPVLTQLEEAAERLAGAAAAAGITIRTQQLPDLVAC